jgi:hypothetical protein
MRLPAKHLLNRLKTEDGQVLVLTGLALMVLLLAVSLGVDVGYLRYQKQQMQKAADAAAIAGAAARIYNGDYTDAARNDSAANGFTDGQNGITVTVNNPPASGPFAGNSSYVEAIVAQAQPTFFARVGGFTSVNVRGRAVAYGANGKDCIYALDPNNDPSTFLVDGSVTISSACGIVVDSTSSSAINKNGVGGSVVASSIGVVGGYVGSGYTPTPTTGIVPVSDPLAGVPAPTHYSTNCSTQTGPNFTPDTFCGIRISGSGTYTFAPGLYIILGSGITVTGSPTISGTGVTFYLTKDASHAYGGVTMPGSGSVSLSAPTDSSQGGIPGILFFQDRSVAVGTSNSGNNFGGSSGSGFVGSMYFPTTALTYKGTPNLVSTESIIVAYTLDFRGNTSILDYTMLAGGSSPIKVSAMAE